MTLDPRDIGEYWEDKDHCEDIFDTYAVLYRRGLLNLNKLLKERFVVSVYNYNN